MNNKKIIILTTIGLLCFLENGSVVGMEQEDLEVTVTAISYKTSHSMDLFDVKSIEGYKDRNMWAHTKIPGTLKKPKAYFEREGDNAAAVGLNMWVTKNQISKETSYLCTKETLLTKSGIEKLLEDSGYTWDTVKEITLTATLSNTRLEPSWGNNVGSATCKWFLESAK